MSKIVDALKACEKLRAGGAVNESDISFAEEALGLEFSSEYKEYLKEFGFASYMGHEFTGICKSARLNVVDVTQETRNLYDIAPDMYVVEETGYEGVVILQNTKGIIFQIEPNGSPKQISQSLTDYIQAK